MSIWFALLFAFILAAFLLMTLGEDEAARQDKLPPEDPPE